ncbi:MAG: carbohydrate ABC transporter permease [Syntrophomonas sp.]
MKKAGILKLTTGLIIIWSLLPVYWGLRTSLLPESELMVNPLKYLPWPLSWENYQNLLGFGARGGDVWEAFQKAFANSIVTSLESTLLVLVLSIVSGYAFSRFTFKGKTLILALILATMALPIYSVIIPLYSIIIKMGLLDSCLGISLIYAAAFVPLGVWLMKVAFDAIPVELEEAAMVDGASRIRTLLLVLPLASPGMVATAALTFLSAWSQFVIPMILAPQNAKPLTVLITQFVGRSSIDYGLMSAAGSIAILPPLLLVILLSRYLVNGLVQGAMKS